MTAEARGRGEGVALDVVDEDLADVPTDVVDEDLADIPSDVVEEDMVIVVVVPTYDDLPESAFMYVGNLDAERDFTDVRDMVRGYVAALEKGKPGEVYNIGGMAERTNLQVVNAICDLLENQLVLLVVSAGPRGDIY